MLIDLHSHSKLSVCCKIDIKGALLVAKERGMDGFVLTNHYDIIYLESDDQLEFAQRYINEFYHAKEVADELGMKIFFGVEITMSKYAGSHVLLYGVEPEFLLEYPDLYYYELSDLYNLAHKHNAIIIQAHPFRHNTNFLLNLNYLDGIEANCHTIFEGPHLELVSQIASDNKKILTCGGDYHHDSPRPKCGVYFPDDLKDVKDLVNYLANTNKIKLCVQLNKQNDSVIDYEFFKGY